MDEVTGDDNFLNLRHNSAPLTVDIQKWEVPDGGVLSFDYVSLKRVPKDARA